MATQFEIQKAVFLKLDGTAALTDQLAAHAYTALKKAIYDGPPQADDAGSMVTFPYVALGEFTHARWDTDSHLGRESTLTVHTFSRYRGKKELQNIMDAIEAALHYVDLTITGEVAVLCHVDFAESFLEPDGMTRHGVQRVRLITEGA